MTDTLQEAIECGMSACAHANRMYAPDAKPQCPRCGQTGFKILITNKDIRCDFAGCSCGWGLAWDFYVDASFDAEELELVKAYKLADEIAKYVKGNE